MKILIKYPSRSRPQRFFESLNSIYDLAVDKKNIHVVCTLDTDDVTMNNSDVITRLDQYKNLSYSFGESKSKVDAINRDLDKLPKFDILICFSDDMKFVVHGWDVHVRDAFRGSDLDLLMHFPDQDAKDTLATMYIAGRVFFRRRGYIYFPDYKSLFCDNEIMEQAQALGKYRYIPITIYHHLCPAYGHLPKDEMFISQQATGYSHDQSLYFERKKAEFPVKKEHIFSYRPLLTIMLPTTIDRRKMFVKLLMKLQHQIDNLKLIANIQVIWEEDDKEMSIGSKRQKLLERADGEFVVGIDSDDDIADTYLYDIVAALRSNPYTDHVGFYERCTFDGGNSKRSIFSIRYHRWAENIEGHDYVRCANPKSVIRRTKALEVGFCNCRYGEDIKFSETVTPLLKSEVFIDKELYLYKYTTQEHNFKYGIKDAT